MNRRDFLKVFGVGVVAAAFGPALIAQAAQEIAPVAQCDGWTPHSVQMFVGDVFTIDGRYEVNPVTRRSTGRLQRFVVTATGSRDGLAGTLTITPSLVSE